MKKIFIASIILFATLVPTLRPVTVFAIDPPAGSKLDYSGLVDCDGVVKDKSVEPGRQNRCDFAALMKTINKIINWMFVISIPVATVLFAWAGLLYMTGTPKNRGKANSVFTYVAIGFIIMVSAWIIVRTVVDKFVETDSGATSLLAK